MTDGCESLVVVDRKPSATDKRYRGLVLLLIWDSDLVVILFKVFPLVYDYLLYCDKYGSHPSFPIMWHVAERQGIRLLSGIM